MADKPFEFSPFLGSGKYSDVLLVLYEEEDATGPTSVDDTANPGKRKRREELSMACHAMLLAAASNYCNVKLDNWNNKCDMQSSIGSSKHQIEMPVPPGQLSVGQLLVHSMYQAVPDLSSVPQSQLLQLLLLADRYGVPKAQAAAASALEALPVEQLQWETVTAVYQLPAGCADLAACKPAFVAAAAKMQEQLGDLEDIWARKPSNKRHLLKNLPFAALHQLLQDPATRVASENTVIYTIQQWHRHQLEQQQAPTDAQMKQLLHLVRMQHCSQLYISTIFGPSELAQKAFAAEELLQAAATAGQPPGTLVASRWHILKRYSAWAAPKRPPARLSEFLQTAKVTLAQLKEYVELSLKDSRDVTRHGQLIAFKGIELQPFLKIGKDSSTSRSNSSSSSMGPGLQLGAGLVVRGLPNAGCCLVSCKVVVLAADGQEDLEFQAYSCMLSHSFNRMGAQCGVPTIQLGQVQDWAGAEQMLRQQGWVHADESLRVSYHVTKVV